ncbi:MAG: GTP cyclohydrolase II [Saprospiraceae bacterium]|nr:GTP cyclohydrolase II [Saprospiraceae bacterium]
MMKAMSKANIPTDWGVFEIVAYGDHADDQMPHLAMIHEKTHSREGVLVRIHSECMTGDLFQSHRCECGTQLHKSLESISEEGGILVYLRQEGRGIGLIEKLKAYELQDQGLDTVEANVKLGHAPDERSFDLGIQILQDLGIVSIRLLTNNPDKIKAIEDSNIELIERIPLIIEPGASNKEYIQTKKKVLGHLLD